MIRNDIFWDKMIMAHFIASILSILNWEWNIFRHFTKPLSVTKETLTSKLQAHDLPVKSFVSKICLCHFDPAGLVAVTHLEKPTRSPNLFPRMLWLFMTLMVWPFDTKCFKCFYHAGLVPSTVLVSLDNDRLIF